MISIKNSGKMWILFARDQWDSLNSVTNVYNSLSVQKKLFILLYRYFQNGVHITITGQKLDDYKMNIDIWIIHK